MLQGVFTALPTPFLTDGTLDKENLCKLLEAQLKAGVHGVVLLGTTAETPALTAADKKTILDLCVPLIKKHGAQLIIGVGTNNTPATLENIRQAAPYQPNAVLVVTPYYNKPNPSGLLAHYQACAQEGIPLVLYHIPGRTGLKVPTAVLNMLLEKVPQLIAVKESDYDIAHVTDVAVLHAKRISYLCGNDDLFPQFLALNGAGIISAAASVLAPAFVKIYNLFKAGKTQESFAAFAQAYPLIKACYLETNPTCIKYMLEKLAFGSQTVRAPLGEISAEHKAQIDTLLKQTPKEFLIK
ncbi:MAG: 4-hydroxy-tetrahydrodipicolinate synthase [Elusimicrobiaceae bacterium]|nr:4-hydroxy-tetrahydrodipicolinate synthase [Elusimicrobiaceae bacterium]